MRILVSQHEQTDVDGNRVDKYVNWGVIYDVVPSVCSLYISLLEVPGELQQKLEPMVRRKGFEGQLYSCNGESFSRDDALGSDQKTKVAVFESTRKGFDYRVLLKPGQKVRYTDV